MKPTLKKILIAAAVLTGVLLVWLSFFRKKEVPLTVIAQKPDTGYIAQSVTATGKVEPVDTVTVGTQVSGIIRTLYVDFNSRVKKGELLAQLDKSLLQATLDQYKGNLSNAESQLVFAKNNFGRQNTLYKTDAISKADYDGALNSYNAALAQVSTAQAQVRLAEKNLSYADIYSPIDGVVLNRNVSIGQTVAASFNTPTLFIIARDITKMEVEANVDEADIGNVATGDRVTFTVDAFINDQFDGKVREIRLHPSVSSNVVTYTTIINASNEDMKLKPGMTASVIIYTKEVNNALLIPVKALSFSPDSSLMKNYRIAGPVGRKTRNSGVNRATGSMAKSQRDTSAGKGQKATVWVLQGKQLLQKKIRVGLSDNANIEVLSGLSPQDMVITGVTGGSAGNASSGNIGGSPFLPRRQSQGGGRNR